MEDNISLYDLLSQAEKNNREDTITDLYGHLLVQKAINRRIPIAIQFELLPICNFNCKFCYIRMTPEEVKKSGHHIMLFDEWKEYVDQVCEMNIPSITFTGGECTLHPDFIRLYEYAYSKGLQVGMISNGSNITPEILEMFEKYPPSKVYITLYGFSAETYERVCSNGNAFKKVLRNIESMLLKNINVLLNFTCSKDNICDMEAVLAYGRSKKIVVLPSDALQVQRKCTLETIEREKVQHELFREIEVKHLSLVQGRSIDDINYSFFNNYDEPYNDPIKPGLQCNAGRCMFVVNWLGQMKPCANINNYLLDPRQYGGMEKCWKMIVDWADHVPALAECVNCIFRNKCRRCAAIHYGDMGEFGKVSPRFCFKVLYPEAAEKMQAEYDCRQAEKAAKEKENSTIQGDL